MRLSRYLRRGAQEILSYLQRDLGFESRVDEYVQLAYLPTSAGAMSRRSLRILYVALHDDYGAPRRGLSFEYNAFFLSLLHMGHELISFDVGRIHREEGQRRTNEMLLEAVYRYRPELMFVVLFRNELERETVAEISALSETTTFNWFSDDDWRFDNYSRHWASVFNWVATTSKVALMKYQSLGHKNVILTQWACNHFLYRPLSLPKTYDVSFVGQLHGERGRTLNQIRRAGIDVKAWGFGAAAGRLTTTEMIKVINQSRINLGMAAASRPGVSQIKARNFEVPGCGALLLTEYVEGLEEYYEIGKEVACYRGSNELVESIRYYLDHEDERQRVAEAGYRRTLEDHTYEKRLDEIFGRMGMS